MYIQQYCDNQIIREGSINSFHGIFFLNYNGEFILSVQNIGGVEYKVYSMSDKTTCTDFIFTIKF